MNTPLYPTYARYDVAFERGEGAYLFDTDGRRYLDFAAGIAVNVLGHCHPRMVQAVKRQAERLWHVSNLYRIPEQERVAAKLTANSFADAVFFCNSGAEAVETGLKTVRRFHHEEGNPRRWRVSRWRARFTDGRWQSSPPAAKRSTLSGSVHWSMASTRFRLGIWRR